MDAWDGSPASRQRITQGWIDAGVRNPVGTTAQQARRSDAQIIADTLAAETGDDATAAD